MGRGADPQATIERLRADRRETQRELGTFLTEVDSLEQQLNGLERELAGTRELVRWLLKDQNVPELDVTVKPGSAVDLEMLRRLVDVMNPNTAGAAMVAGEWTPLTDRFRARLDEATSGIDD